MRLVRISFAPKRLRSRAGIAAHAAPPRIPVANISGSTSGDSHPGREDRDGGPGDRTGRELAFRADVPEIRAEADREAGADQHQWARSSRSAPRSTNSVVTGSMK